MWLCTNVEMQTRLCMNELPSCICEVLAVIANEDLVAHSEHAHEVGPAFCAPVKVSSDVDLFRVTQVALAILMRLEFMLC